MKRRWTLGVLALLAAVFSTVEGQDAKSVLGTWKGTSLCVNLDAAPGCKNEEVVYEFRETSPPSAGKLTLAADKIVNGERLPMGELEFAWDAKGGAWVCEMKNRYHALWTFPLPVDGELTGTLVLLPEKTVVRKVAARRPKG